jgi:hypothetical protein
MSTTSAATWGVYLARGVPASLQDTVEAPEATEERAAMVLDKLGKIFRERYAQHSIA